MVKEWNEQIASLIFLRGVIAVHLPYVVVLRPFSGLN